MKSFTVSLSLSLSLSLSSDLPNHKEDPNDLSCDERAAQFQMLSTADCNTSALDHHGTTMKSKTDMLQWRYKCCGTGQSACAPDPVDYSAAVCKDESSCTLCCTLYFVLSRLSLSLFLSVCLSVCLCHTHSFLSITMSHSLIIIISYCSHEIIYCLSLSLSFFRSSGAQGRSEERERERQTDRQIDR